MTSRTVILFLLVASAACSAPAMLPDLAEAEAHERDGDTDAALAAYDRAIERCGTVHRRRRRATCANAHLGRAELLDRAGRTQEAIAAYEAIPVALGGDPAPSSRALFRAGELRLAAGDEVGGWELLWRAITEYPDAPSADLALNLIVADGRSRDPRKLYEVLGQLAARLNDTEVADNLHFAMAELAEDELDDPHAALAHYDAVAAGSVDGALWDDAVWHSARLARQLGDPKGAVERYRKLLATREVALMVGSYFSVWHDDAQLELGRTLRDDLGDDRGALAAFERLPKDYPDSILHDDAMFERAATYEKLGDTERACKRLATLARKWPDSKYELEQAPAMRERLGCRVGR